MMPEAETTRRDFIRLSSLATVGTALGSSSAPVMAAQATASAFDINDRFDEFMKEIGGHASDGGGSVTFTGSDPIVRSHFRIGACMAIPAMAAGVGAAAIWRERTGEGQDLSVDLRESVYNTMPYVGLILQKKQAAGVIDPEDNLPRSFTWRPKVNGRELQLPLLFNNPLSFAFFETKDGRMVTPTGLYPQHFVGFLNILGAPPDRAAIAAAIRQWNAEELDDKVGEAGMVMAIHRTKDEWLAHPQGQYLAKLPVIEIEKIGDSNPVPYSPNPTQPLSGIKVVSCSHVIASTTAARTLAEYGADVLHVARDQAVEHEGLIVDVNVGMRSTLLNLKDPSHSDDLRALLKRADVFVEGFRGRAMGGLGFGPEDVAAQRPGIVYLSCRAYGWNGPWWNRAAFDMEALTTTGFTLAEGHGTPRFPPTMVLNDYISGYIGAAGILAALRRRAKEGGSYHVRITLARAAMWFMTLGQFDSLEFDYTAPEHRMIPLRTFKAKTPYGEVDRLAPQVKLSKTPGRWRDPLVAVRGGDLPVWLD
jgi:crotonobetainyl-CoA:carnitine CoA-transferase CaiB-like acyl-CoA transferase